MTAATPPPPRDGEVCQALTGCVNALGRHNRRCPAAPSEPPAETQQDEAREAVAKWLAGTIAWECEPDNRPEWLRDAHSLLALPAVRALGARPSADTETLRRVRELLDAPRDGSNYLRADLLRAVLDAR